MVHYLIPARGGSKTIPDKNLQLVGGHPLLAWTVCAAKDAALPNDVVVVNSDHQKTLELAEVLGAKTYRRPDYLGQEETSMRDVLAEYLRQRPQVDTLVVLYPTCPYRTARSIRRAVDGFEHAGARSLMSVRADRSRPFGGLRMADDRLVYGVEAQAFYRKQETPTLYYATGGVFIIKRDELPRLNNQLFNPDTKPFVLNLLESLDIDTEEELELARAMASSQLVRRPASLMAEAYRE